MQDLFPIPSCFSPSPTLENPTTTDESSSSSSITATITNTKLGQSIATSTYRAIISNHPHLITITWCKNLLTLSLYLSIQPLHVDVDNIIPSPSTCIKVEMRPWHFWRGRQGSKRCSITHYPTTNLTDVAIVDLFWDLKSAKFSSDSDHPEPLSNYYVALVFRDEIVLLLGDLNHDAFRTTGSRPSIFEPVLVAKKEHVFGRRKFVTRAKFEEKGKFHEVSIESRSSSSDDDEMVIKIDGCVGIEVRHLEWKFRGHDSVRVSKTVRVEVYWDVHDWLFSTGGGLRHALFIFKPIAPPVLSLSSSSSSSSLNSLSSSSMDQGHGGGRRRSSSIATESTSDFCLFLYAWKLE